MALESRFGYGKGFTFGSHSSNFAMSDASNVASIAILARFPPAYPPHKGCFCIECAAILHEQEAHFDAIKTEIENCMEIAFKEGVTFQIKKSQKEGITTHAR